MKSREIISVKLIGTINVDPLELTSHAALECYQAESPNLGQMIDVENRLFKTGHHTTLQHYSFTFNIEGISVGDITFGFHLVNPFYNSDQRSGRFCSAMFEKPRYVQIQKYIETFWLMNDPYKEEKIKAIMSYIRYGIRNYKMNLTKGEEIAARLIKEERTFASEKYITGNARKIAQEQLRMIVPVIFPTGFDYTINLTVLAAYHRIAWNPVMKFVVARMVDEVLLKYPELHFIFDAKESSKYDWSPELNIEEDGFKIKSEPEMIYWEMSGIDHVLTKQADMFPVDLLHFSPEYMANGLSDILSEIEISVATMGQDQRHRTIRRGQPQFTGNFYLPAIPKECGLERCATRLVAKWLELRKWLPSSLWAILAPYGAMVRYEKRGNLNAIAHEQQKRQCFCAQEEIYNLSRKLRTAIKYSDQGTREMLSIFEPYCFKTGKCAEGARYCGRDISRQKKSDYFPRRKI